MSAFLVIVLIVAAAAVLSAILAAAGVLKRPARAPHGSTWIDHPDEVPIEERPSEDVPDDPVDLVPRARH